MLNRENRLVTDFEYKVVRKYASAFECPSFFINYLMPTNYKGPTKVGIIVSNKFDKRAVVRNIVKRKFRKLIRDNFDKIKEGYWIVINPKINSLNKSYEEINVEYLSALQKVPFTR